ncbi:MAG: peptidylprolyl isomerase [Verrucomicrobiae bacterium]|nr:peptidylprolyl isomerase [Verrucomicrobiae bacterium]
MSAVESRAKFPWRALLYAVIIVYLVADLYWFEGPLRQKIDRQKAFTKYSLQRALAEGWVATVNGKPVTREQLEQATAVYLFRQGKSPETVSSSALQVSQRMALWQLIEDTLVRQYSKAEGFHPDPALVERRIQDFTSQFPDRASLLTHLEAVGLDEAGLRLELEAQESQRQWIEARISEAAEVTEADLRQWYEENAATDPGTQNPPLVRARHLFLSTVMEDTPEKEERIRECHRLLTSGEVTFEALAADASEDERSKRRGGDLGWFGPGRMPRDFSDVAFGLRPGQRSEPFRTSLGWHIVEVLETREPESLGFEALKPEIRAWLETERRRYAIQILMNRLKTVAVIEVFPDNLAVPGAKQ